MLASALGAQDEAKAMRARGNALLCLGLASVFLTVTLWFSYPALLRWLGAEGDLYAPAEEYVQVIILCCAAQVLNSGVNPLLRSAGRTFLAMTGMVMGLLCNIFLDWLFIMPLNWGMRGAALATVLAQLLSALFQLTCLVLHKQHPMRIVQFIPSASLLRRLVFTGLSPFGLSLSASILIPVSYTHLDVYERQAHGGVRHARHGRQRRTGRQGQRPQLNCIRKLFHNLVIVSYI